jgi:5-methylcytosine-specific restriction endonuclease McrA
MRTLVVNSEDIPVSVITPVEAVKRVYRGVATVMENYDKVFYSNIHDIDAYDYTVYGGLGGFFDKELIKNTKLKIVLYTPAVIKLITYSALPYEKKGITLSRRNVFLRDGYECQYENCETTLERIEEFDTTKLPVEMLTWDHIFPKSRGGQNTWTNLTTCCQACNNKKDNKTPEEAGMVLMSQPYEPKHIPLVLESPSTPDEWRDWLYWNVSLQD